MPNSSEHAESPERNWRTHLPRGWSLWLGLALIVGGFLLVREGLLREGFSDGAWSAVFIELGVAVGLITVVVWLEPYLVRQARRAGREGGREEFDAQAEGLREEARELRERMVALENLDAATSEEERRREAARDKVIQAIRVRDFSMDQVADLIELAEQDNLFDGRFFGVRTSTEDECSVLHFGVVPAMRGRSRAVVLDFEPIRWTGRPEYPNPEWDGRSEPIQTKSMVIWTADQSAAVMGAELNEALRRGNQPLHSFTIRFALERLAASVEIMRKARAAEAGSPLRLQGSIRLLINEHWAWTSSGLESVQTNLCMPTAVWTSSWDHETVRRILISPRPDRTPAGSDEALAWMVDREGYEPVDDAQSLIAPDDAPF